MTSVDQPTSAPSAAPARAFNAFAIAAFLACLVGAIFTVLANDGLVLVLTVPLACFALHQTRGSGRGDRELAVVSLVVSSAFLMGPLVAIAVALVTTYMTRPLRRPD